MSRRNTLAYELRVEDSESLTINHLHDAGEERETDNWWEDYKVECRYLDYGSQVFGEASIKLTTEKFRGKQRSSTPGQAEDRGDLVSNSHCYLLRIRTSSHQ